MSQSVKANLTSPLPIHERGHKSHHSIPMHRIPSIDEDSNPTSLSHPVSHAAHTPPAYTSPCEQDTQASYTEPMRQASKTLSPTRRRATLSPCRWRSTRRGVGSARETWSSSVCLCGVEPSCPVEQTIASAL